MNITTIEIDLAKNTFSLHGVDNRGKRVFCKTFKPRKAHALPGPTTALSDWHGGLQWCPLLGPRIDETRPPGRDHGVPLHAHFQNLQAQHDDQQDRKSVV